MSPCCSHCNSSVLLPQVVLSDFNVCFWKSLFRWISTSILVYHVYMISYFAKKKKNPNTDCCLSLKKAIETSTCTLKQIYCSRRCWHQCHLLERIGAVMFLLWRTIQCVCGYQVSEVIFYTFLCSIFYLHWLMAPALHMCNKCYSVLYFLCTCVVFLSANTAWVFISW